MLEREHLQKRKVQTHNKYMTSSLEVHHTYTRVPLYLSVDYANKSST